MVRPTRRPPDTHSDAREIRVKRTGIQALKNALRLADATGHIQPAKPSDLKRAERAGFPRDLVRFYKRYEPDPNSGYIELKQRIYCIARALRENLETLPGAGLYAEGFVVFAGTTSGDVYCFDTNVETERGLNPIILFGRNLMDESPDLVYIWYSRVEVASSLDDFLLKFSAGELSEEAQYGWHAEPEIRRTYRPSNPRKTGVQALEEALRRAGDGGRVRPAKPKDLERAERAGFPRELIEFYGKCEPHPGDQYVELEQRIYCIALALRENRKTVLGRAIFPHGYVVFAGTCAGDPYCLDTTKTERGRHPVALFGHEVIHESTDLAYILASRVEVASSLDDFLRKFSEGRLDDDAYPLR